MIRAEEASAQGVQVDVANVNGGDTNQPQQQNATQYDGQIPPLMGMNDPRRNLLTGEEQEHAIALKELVESMPDLEMSDFMCAQYAIVLKEDLEEAVRRAFALEEFKKEYEILDTYEEGCRCLERAFQLMPGQLLGFSYSQEEGTYVFAHDATKLDSTNLDTPNKVHDWMRCNYYMHTVFCPDLETIRKGIVCLAECEGWDWTKKQDAKLFQKFFNELLTVYPFNGQVRHYHTGMVVNVVASMLRQILPPHLRNTFRTGLTFEGRLDKFFLVPDAKTANRRMLNRLQATLKRRYNHEKTFVLPENR